MVVDSEGDVGAKVYSTLRAYADDKPAAFELVRVRAQIEHPMESGLRTDASGHLRPRHIISRFEARLGPHLLFVWEAGISVSPAGVQCICREARSKLPSRVSAPPITDGA